MKNYPWTKFIVIFSGSLSLIFFVYYAFFYNKAYFQISMTSSHDSELQLYWAGKKQAFSEERSKKIDVYKKTKTYVLYFDNLDKIERIRIDPINRKGLVTIHSIIIRQEEYEPIYIIDKNCFNSLNPSGSIDKTKYNEDGLNISSIGKDPRLSLELGKTRITRGRDTELMRILFAMVASGSIAALACRNTSIIHVPANKSQFAFILGLTILMAVMSRYNLHPDEAVHYEAAKYYENHWAPPKVCDPSIQYTYSRYGVSRLDTPEIAYWIAGKANSILKFAFLEPYLRYRVFNIVLLTGIIILGLKDKRYLLFLLPIIISPQIWYVYSYFSSDAFALTLGIFLTYQMLNKDSFLLSTVKTNKIDIPFLLRSSICGAMIGMYFFVKINYQVLFIFWIGYLGIEIFQDPGLLGKHKKGILSVFLTTVTFVCAIHSLHLYSNGADKTEKILACQEQLAERAFKPSTPYNKQFPTLNIKAKGLPLTHVTEDKHWGGRIFASSFGVYGHTSIIAFPLYYTVVKYLLILLTGYLIVRIFRSGDVQHIVMLVGVLSCTLILLAAALYHSWTVDIQAQGRYLFPLIPMYGALLYKTKYFDDDALFNLLTNGMFVISIYSFLFVGLFNMVQRNSLPF